MKIYVNLLFDIIKKIENWENIDSLKKQIIFSKYININKKNMYILDYFDKYLNYLKNNTLNSLLKGVIKLNF